MNPHRLLLHYRHELELTLGARERALAEAVKSAERARSVCDSAFSGLLLSHCAREVASAQTSLREFDEKFGDVVGSERPAGAVVQ